MSGDRVVYDRDMDVYRVRNAAGVLVGAENGGYPLAMDTRMDAEDLIERRAEMATYLERRREALRLGRSWW